MSTILEEINAVQAVNTENYKNVETVEEQLKKELAKNQSGIAWLIVWTFVLFVGSIIVFVFLNLAPPNGCVGEACNTQQWTLPADFLLKMLNSVMLPIVTLVLGYYFGSEQKK